MGTGGDEQGKESAGPLLFLVAGDCCEISSAAWKIAV